MKSLIICPVGNPVTFHDVQYERSSHWRFVNNDRAYETLVIQYGNFCPEDGTYDRLIQQKGQKWELMKSILPTIDYTQYEYIGFFDDDLITSADAINQSLLMAHDHQFKIFQLAVTADSDVFYPILRQNPDALYAMTNFVEVMGPFIHTSLIPLCVELWNRYEIASGWGFDKILCDLTQTPAAVIHAQTMFHPKKDTSYDKTKAFAEMDQLLYSVFPQFMKEKYNRAWSFQEAQYNLSLVLKS